jgi:hypothetical protein
LAAAEAALPDRKFHIDFINREAWCQSLEALYRSVFAAGVVLGG